MPQPISHTGNPGHICGAASPVAEWWECLDCDRARMHRRKDAAKRAAITRAKNHPEWAKPEHADAAWQRLAHRVVADAKRHGLLPILDGTIACVDCGAPAQEYDHRDYSKPLDVEPVCICCNRRRGTATWPSADEYHFKRVTAPQKKAG